jgi:ribosomal protein L9
MKVLFIEDVPKVAMTASKEVSDGYVRNYLCPTNCRSWHPGER